VSLYKFFDGYQIEVSSTNKEITKICVWCLIEKHISQFPKHKSHKDGYDSRCRECIKRESKIRYRLKKTAPPKPEVCPICEKVPKKWVLDHDHETGLFRGWLCDSCNLALGLFGDQVKGLLKGIEYLQRTSKND